MGNTSLDSTITDAVERTVAKHVGVAVQRLAGQTAPAAGALYLTTAQAAERYGVCGRMIRVLTERGAPVVRIGAALRYPATELDAWMREYAARPRTRRARAA